VWWSRFRKSVISVTEGRAYIFKYFLIYVTRFFSGIDRSLSSSIPKILIKGPADYMIGISEVAGMNERAVELKAFVQFLKEKCGFTFDVNRFDHRIMLQKYVFLAKSLGWPNDYTYNLYIRGPYSPDLAKDYYNLEAVSTCNVDKTTIRSLDEERFIRVINGKNVAWLEVGITMLSVYNNNKDSIDGNKIAQFLLERTKSIKSDYDNGGFIEQILHDLVEYRLIRLN
jgi:uncharacterized protein YwgA